MTTDVVVVGGGPAGAAAALLLGRAGLSVELIERARFPREKPCGEGLMPAGVDALARWGLAEAVGGAPFLGVRYHAGGVVAAGRFPPDGGRAAVGRGQRRLVLDRVLFEAAAATPGVRARAGVAVEAPIVEAGRVVGVVAAGRQRRARLVVAADGLRSPLRRQLGLEAAPPARRRVGVRAHFRLARPRAGEPWVDVYLGRGHELYVTPLPDGELLVAGLAEAAAVAGGAERALAAWLADQPALAERLVGAERVTGLQGRWPLAASARAGAVPGCLLLGDAAGYLDPITGGGMTQALLSAELLASLATRLLADDPTALVDLARARRALLGDYQLVTGLVLALARRPRLAAPAVRLMAAWPALFSHLIGVAGGTRRLRPVWPGRSGAAIGPDARAGAALAPRP